MKILQAHTGDPDVDATGSRGIGGSTAAAVYGVHRYLSPYALWSNLSGFTTSEFAGNEATELGQELELPLLRWYAKAHQRAVVVVRATFVHPEHEWMMCNVDGFEVEPTDRFPAGEVVAVLIDMRGAMVVETDKGNLTVSPTFLSVIEVKTTGLAGRGDAASWRDGAVPVGYEFQAMHCCAVVDLRRAVFVAMIGGEGRQTRERVYTDEMVERLTHDEAAFMERVKSGNAPDLDATQSTTDTLKSRYRTPEPESKIEADPDTVSALAMYAEAQLAEKDAKTEVNYWRNVLVAAIGDHEALTVGNKIAATYKTVTKSEYVVGAQSYRQLSLVKPKKEKP